MYPQSSFFKRKISGSSYSDETLCNSYHAGIGRLISSLFFFEEHVVI